MKINMEEIKGSQGIVSEYEGGSLSHTLPQSLTASCLRQKQVLPTHSGGHLTLAFPDEFLGLMEHSWMHDAPLQPHPGMGFADSFTNGGWRFLMVYITLTLSQKRGAKGVRDPV